jgi:hypothetical protein
MKIKYAQSLKYVTWGVLNSFLIVVCPLAAGPVQQSEECVICGYFPYAVFVDFCARVPRFLQRRNLYKEHMTTL